MTYAEKLLDPRWQKKRIEILQRDNWTCMMCNDRSTTLHVHHKTYKKGCDPWDTSNEELITYCKVCHKLLSNLNVNEEIVFLRKGITTTGQTILVIICKDDSDLHIRFISYNKETENLNHIIGIKEATFKDLKNAFENHISKPTCQE